MSLRLDQLLKACTVRIEVSGGRSRGTGFFFAPKMILTCAHVVRKKVGEFVEVFPADSEQPIQAKVRYFFPEQFDLLILEAHTEQQFPCVFLGAEVQPKDSCYTYGYTDAKQGFPDGDPVTLECEGLTGGLFPKIKLKGGQVRPGLSGSPLLNFNTGKVCGVIKETRADGFDLGGVAVSTRFIFSELPVLEKLHSDYHKVNTTWIQLLNFDVEAFTSDWTYLDEEAQRKENYFKTLFFLIKVAFKWFILGRKAPRAFPMQTIALLIEHTFKGDLGQEIKRQREELTRKLTFEVDPEGYNQARILNELDSKAQVLEQLIGMLITEKQDLASASRLLWVTEVINEQRDLIEDLKKKEGNSYPQLEQFKRSFRIFSDKSDKKYSTTDKVINKLLIRYTDTNFVLSHSLKVSLFEIIENLEANPRLNCFYAEKIFKLLSKALEHEPVSKKSSIDLVLEDLEKEIQENPELKILRKIQILLETVVGELVQGGSFRAWSATGVYHFNRQCKLYPERAHPEEMRKILCYDTREEAERKHKPCKVCLNAEKLESEADFLGDELV